MFRPIKFFGLLILFGIIIAGCQPNTIDARERARLERERDYQERVRPTLNIFQRVLFENYAKGPNEMIERALEIELENPSIDLSSVDKSKTYLERAKATCEKDADQKVLHCRFKQVQHIYLQVGPFKTVKAKTATVVTLDVVGRFAETSDKRWTVEFRSEQIPESDLE